MTELGLLAEQVGTSERTLRRAFAEGALHGSRASPRTLQMPLAERDYIRRHWSLLASLRSALRTEPSVRFALLFGSCALGTDTLDSDVDLLVDLREVSFERFVDLRTKLKAILGRHIDMVELHDAKREPAFLAQVLSVGRVLVDRDGVWPRLRNRQAALWREGRREEARRLHTALSGIDRLLASSR
jgi:predicted nucleotidyltransferase